MEAAMQSNGINTAGKILLMDDDASIRDVVGEMLVTLGYRVEYACDGVEALDLFREAWRSAAPFDALIMDLTIPGGMGGIEALQQILTLDPSAKAIASSGYTNDSVFADVAEYGFRGSVAKPFRIQDLDAVLNNVVK